MGPLFRRTFNINQMCALLDDYLLFFSFTWLFYEKVCVVCWKMGTSDSSSFFWYVHVALLNILFFCIIHFLTMGPFLFISTYLVIQLLYVVLFCLERALITKTRWKVSVFYFPSQSVRRLPVWECCSFCVLYYWIANLFKKKNNFSSLLPQKLRYPPKPQQCWRIYWIV